MSKTRFKVDLKIKTNKKNEPKTGKGQVILEGSRKNLVRSLYNVCSQDPGLTFIIMDVAGKIAFEQLNKED